MDTLDLMTIDFETLEKKRKKGKSKKLKLEEIKLAPEEIKLIAEKNLAREKAKQCCQNCVYSGTYKLREVDNTCKWCYSIYDEEKNRFWLSRYKKKTE